MTFEFVSGVDWRAGVRWDGDWHLAKEGLGLFVSRAPTTSPLEARGTDSDRWEHSEGAPQGQEREGTGKWKRVVKEFVKKMEEGENKLGSGG